MAILTLNGVQVPPSAALNVVTADFIEGLKLVYVGAKAITIRRGCACRPSDGLLMQPAADIALTGLTIAASTMYHCYMYMNGAVPAVEVVTTAPVQYLGIAYQKTGDTSRRYIGSVVSDSSGNILPFVMVQNAIFYNANVSGAPLLLLSNGVATTPTDVDCSPVVPLTSGLALAFLYNATTNTATVLLSNSAGPTMPAGYMGFVGGPNQGYPAQLVLDSARKFSYMYNSAPAGGGGFLVRITGYIFER